MSEGASKNTRNDRALFWALVIVAVGLFVNALVMASPECSPAPQVQQTEKGQNNNHAFGVISIAYAPVCGVGRFIRVHKDTIDGLSTLVIAAFTVILAWSTVRLWKETERLADGAKTQAEDTQSALAISNRSADAAIAAIRPWIKMDVELVGPLVWDDRGIRCPVKLTLKNMGKSPTSRLIHFEFFINGEMSSVDFTERCKSSQRYFNSGGPHIGGTLFPDEDYHADVVFTSERMDSIPVTIKTSGWFYFPSFGLGVTYEFAGGVGLTAKRFTIYPLLADGRVRDVGIFKGETIEKEHLLLGRSIQNIAD